MPDDPDVAGIGPVPVDECLARGGAEDDHGVAHGDQATDHVALVGGGIGPDGMQHCDRWNAQLIQHGQRLLAVRSPVAVERVLEESDIKGVQRGGR